MGLVWSDKSLLVPFILLGISTSYLFISPLGNKYEWSTVYSVPATKETELTPMPNLNLDDIRAALLADTDPYINAIAELPDTSLAILLVALWDKPQT